MSLRASALGLEVDTLGLRTGSPTPSMRVPPPWVLPGAAIDFDFANNRYWQEGMPGGRPATAYLTTSRASIGYINDDTGIWYSVATGTPRISNQGLLVEEARTNDALWCRDMTNAAWVKTTMTVAKTATGIDGIANSASNLTATGANSTILQTITLVSQADTYSVWLKRVTGTGEVDITVDGGTTWTAAVLTAAYQQFQVTKTAANPIIGIRIVVNGDAVAADFNQLEPGGFATSPILTTSATATRAADNVKAATVPVFAAAHSFAVEYFLPSAPSASATALMALDDGTNSNREQLGVFNGPATYTCFGVVGGVVQWNSGLGNGFIGSVSKGGVAVAASDIAQIYQGTLGFTQASGTPISAQITRIGFGSTAVGAIVGARYLRRAAIWPNNRLSNVALEARTT